MTRSKKSTSKLRISVSDLIYFNECRRKWLWYRTWGSKEPAIAQWVGTAVHKGVEAFFRTKDHQEAVLAYRLYVSETIRKISTAMGVLWQGIEQNFVDAGELGEGMVINFCDYYVDAHPELLTGTVIGVEEYLQTELIEGEVDLVGKVDLILHDSKGRVILVDHKTAARALDEQALDVDSQLTGYAYLWTATHNGELPHRIVYNVLYKGVPTPPAVIKGGKLSKSKSQFTTSTLYRAEIEARELAVDDYQDILNYFAVEGWNTFFKQVATSRNWNEIDAYELRSMAKAREIQRALKEPEIWAYPDPGMYKCPGCEFLVPCKMADDGGDHESVLDARFTRDRLY